MKALLIQNASGEAYEHTLKRVSRWHLSYCKRHDIKYVCYYGRPKEADLDRHPVWDRMKLVREALSSGFDFVANIDVDALIVRDVDLREAAAEFENVGAVRHPLGFPPGASGGHLNIGAIYLKNTELARRLIVESDELGDVEDYGYGWHEQSAVLTANKQLGAMTQIHDRWNSTDGVNECNAPIVRAWHGQGRRGLLKLERVLDGLENANPWW